MWSYCIYANNPAQEIYCNVNLTLKIAFLLLQSYAASAADIRLLLKSFLQLLVELFAKHKT